MTCDFFYRLIDDSQIALCKYNYVFNYCLKKIKLGL